MKTKIGRFDAYVPDYDASDIILEVLVKALEKGDRKLFLKKGNIYKFYQEMKEAFPDIMEDIHFNFDSDFPYSEEIDLAFSVLQDLQIIEYNNQMKAYISTKHLKDIMNRQTEIGKIAKLFRERFVIKEKKCI